jgi:hypothetical protein
MMPLTFQQTAMVEALRSARTGRGFTLVRVAPAGWAALDAEMDALASTLEATVRRTDTVLRTRDREVGVVLIESVEEQAQPPIARMRAAAALHLPKMELRIGWASVGPGHRRSWEEAWRWAGQLLVADAAVPAAA